MIRAAFIVFLALLGMDWLARGGYSITYLLIAAAQDVAHAIEWYFYTV